MSVHNEEVLDEEFSRQCECDGCTTNNWLEDFCDGCACCSECCNCTETDCDCEVCEARRDND